MFNSTESDQNSQTSLIQQCLANYDYSNATALAEDLLLHESSEENKGLLADCYLLQQENQKAYFLLQNSTLPINLYKLAVVCLRLNKLAGAESALLGGREIPNGVHGIELLATVFRKQGKLQEAKEGHEEAVKRVPMLLAKKKELDKLNLELEKPQPKGDQGGLLGGNYSAGNQANRNGLFGAGSVGEKKRRNGDVRKAVDEYFDEQDCEVFTGNDGKLYSKMLYQSNIRNNNNKFFILQVLESTKNRGIYFFWTRWGRVGEKGQMKKVKGANLEETIKMFNQKVEIKTIKGDYVEIEMG